ncbi:MAG: tRNA (5-methylaminomethyl-2-thiouridine)(34)-methyltransferase MnmD [Bacteroidetes bacterium]|nr:tRNA (5-methylaminomethyl-2-thiouridine)(34)-methyltransferase MnmD [Bacteroidota bacterium]MCL1968079.1 tRNA (5-methylaminomethyl-2-thiouridine)(34)-methyltransferase MnmD [Bacteroidota bacterium]
MKRQIVLTDDGSNSIFSEEVNQHYHSHFGALQESMHIFINAGLCSDTINHLETVSILEIGFGTGLNALLTCFKAQELHKKIYYEALELYPLTLQEAEQLNYPSLLPYSNGKEIFTALHNAEWNTEEKISETFILHKRHISAINANYTPDRFNLVYFDAFSPEVQPELWTKEVFTPIYNSMENDSILLTYCTKGSIKQTLTALGFHIEKLPGPVGKREILRAKKYYQKNDVSSSFHTNITSYFDFL